jgi:molybdate transport system substrate-binding protein
MQNNDPLKIIPYLLVILTLLLTACSPNPNGMISSPTEILDSTPSQASILTVMAAASLTAPFTELGQLFETSHPGVKVEFDFAGSQQLEQQINLGAPADVFASAATNYMDLAVKNNLVMSSSVEIFAKNRLVVIFPVSNPGGLSKLQDLAKPGLKIDLADKAVPVGAYTLQFLSKASQDPAFGASFEQNVLNNVVSYEDNVKAVVTKVALNQADAGVCYTTDIAGSVASALGKLDIPDNLNVIAVYPLAPLAKSPHLELAKAFISLVTSPSGRAVMQKYGFMPPG